jgi:ABC-type phosphate transport system substrate-binding protein
MRKLIIASATAVAIGTLGLSAAAQAQPASHTPRITATTVAKTVVAGIPAAFEIKNSGSGCVWKITTGAGNIPSSVTAKPGTKTATKCTELLDGVWPTPTKAGKPLTTTITATAAGKVTTYTVKVTVQAAPPATSAVGMGSDTITPLTDQLATDYNATAPSGPLEYSWDAVNPITGAIGDSIAVKTGCTHIARPDGSSAGISALAGSQVVNKVNCVNFARSSRPRSATDPAFAPGGVAFVALAGDAVSWSHQATTNAPATLTVAQLNAIYSCTDTNWSQVGGKSGTIAPFLPQSGSGTLAFFEAAIGITTPGPCVSNVNNTLEENEGVNPALNSPNAIFPYSVGDFIAQSQHSAKCLTASCAPNSGGVVCNHTPDFNQFFCDEHGTMALGQINGINPISGTGKSEKINTAFPSTFDRILFNVVPFDGGTSDHIPGAEANAPGGENLSGIFSNSGYDCTNATSKTDIADYGFLTLGSCGSTS